MGPQAHFFATMRPATVTAQKSCSVSHQWPAASCRTHTHTTAMGTASEAGSATELLARYLDCQSQGVPFSGELPAVAVELTRPAGASGYGDENAFNTHAASSPARTVKSRLDELQLQLAVSRARPALATLASSPPRRPLPQRVVARPSPPPSPPLPPPATSQLMQEWQALKAKHAVMLLPVSATPRLGNAVAAPRPATSHSSSGNPWTHAALSGLTARRALPSSLSALRRPMTSGAPAMQQRLSTLCTSRADTTQLLEDLPPRPHTANVTSNHRSPPRLPTPRMDQEQREWEELEARVLARVHMRGGITAAPTTTTGVVGGPALGPVGAPMHTTSHAEQRSTTPERARHANTPTLSQLPASHPINSAAYSVAGSTDGRGNDADATAPHQPPALQPPALHDSGNYSSSSRQRTACDASTQTELASVAGAWQLLQEAAGADGELQYMLSLIQQLLQRPELADKLVQVLAAADGGGGSEAHVSVRPPVMCSGAAVSSRLTPDPHTTATGDRTPTDNVLALHPASSDLTSASFTPDSRAVTLLDQEANTLTTFPASDRAELLPSAVRCVPPVSGPLRLPPRLAARVHGYLDKKARAAASSPGIAVGMPRTPASDVRANMAGNTTSVAARRAASATPGSTQQVCDMMVHVCAYSLIAACPAWLARSTPCGCTHAFAERPCRQLPGLLGDLEHMALL